jgi:tRNA pseudouridine55 synthase
MNGVLPVDKPVGPTSHDIVAIARRALGIRRVGHTGTLDPFASGLLLLCIGPATRLAEYLSGLDKVYDAAARLGMVTDTLDRTGSVVAETDGWEALEAGQVRAAFAERTGRILQRPPAYSAKKLGGRRAYERARAGEDVAPAAVEVDIHDLQVTAVDGPEVRFTVHCSSGTYVRSIARDAGEALGVGAHLTALRRTAIGGFRVDEALAPEQLGDAGVVAGALVEPLDALRHLPVLELDAREVAEVRHGRSFPARAAAGLLALAADGRLVAIGHSDGARVRPRKVLP